MYLDSPFDDLFLSMKAGNASRPEAMGTLAVLLTETLRYRDRLKAKSGYVLTVQDTRAALNALEYHLTGRSSLPSLTTEQSGLAQIFIRRITSIS